MILFDGCQINFLVSILINRSQTSTTSTIHFLLGVQMAIGLRPIAIGPGEIMLYDSFSFCYFIGGEAAQKSQRRAIDVSFPPLLLMIRSFSSTVFFSIRQIVDCARTATHGAAATRGNPQSRRLFICHHHSRDTSPTGTLLPGRQ